MVWVNLLREVGAKYNVYDYTWDSIDETSTSCDPRSLDPIPKGLPGQLNMKAVRTAAESLKSPVLIHGTGVLASKDTFVTETQPMSRPPAKAYRDTTRPMYLGCLFLLFSWTLLSFGTSHSEIAAFAVFFTVPKSNGKLRTIMDARMLNQCSRRPPPVNLGGMGDCLKKAAELQCKVHIQADISHWFHHFPLPDGADSFFGVRCENKEEARTEYFRCKTMCMGWSWAPYIAQCTALTVLLARNPRDKCTLGVDYDDVATWTELPRFIGPSVS